jgi:CRP-like cAMP-binding protein
MQPKHFAAGTVLFRQGDRAEQVYVVKTGQVRLMEFDKRLSEGALFGEVAVFSDDAKRTATAVCDTDCELYTVAGEKILELFYQDQAFAFLIARRLARYA